MRKGAPRALVIDNDHDVADSFALLLETLGAVAHAAYDGLSGIAAMDELKPDIVFVDIGMPGVDGYETARRIRRGSHAHRFILVALTGWSREEDRRRSRHAGFDLHLAKPASVEEVEAMLRLAKALAKPHY
ncbi:MAG TPA: response regulator [Methylocystis sp.]|jgi:CheY-like chemotaxis protein